MLLRIQSTSKVLSGVPDFSEGVHREIWPFKEDQKESKGKKKQNQKTLSIYLFVETMRLRKLFSLLQDYFY